MSCWSHATTSDEHVYASVTGPTKRVSLPGSAPTRSGSPRQAAARVPDASQDAIVTAPTDARMLVEAGPGYGKTDVACARVAHLIADGVAPPQILLLSFTRTAVREMRTRIQQLAVRGTDVRGVETQCREPVRHRGGAHQLDHARGQRIAGIVDMHVVDRRAEAARTVNSSCGICW